MTLQNKFSFFFLSRFPEFSPEFQSGCLPGYLGTSGCILGMSDVSLEHYLLGQTGCYCDFFTTRTQPLHFSPFIITVQL